MNEARPISFDHLHLHLLHFVRIDQTARSSGTAAGARQTSGCCAIQEEAQASLAHRASKSYTTRDQTQRRALASRQDWQFLEI
jgi:hypothetical protein